MMSRRPLAPLEPKPTMPFPYEHHASESLEDATRHLLTSAVTGDASSLKGWSEYPLLAVVDQDTGDSILHRAAAIGNISFMSGIPGCFGKQFSQSPTKMRLYWVLMVHQNWAGDTALHAAARTGSLQGAKGVHRLFHLEEPADEYGSSSRIEDYDWDLENDDPHDLESSLYFLSIKNRAGHDAAAEARATGHDALAAWLDGLAQKIDPTGRRNDEGYLSYLLQEELKYHRYYENDEKEKNGKA